MGSDLAMNPGASIANMAPNNDERVRRMLEAADEAARKNTQ
jgi:hypothetical protein